MERVGTVLMGGIPDRVPGLPVLTSAARRITGVPFAEWAQDGELHAKCQLQAQELLGLEGMDVFVDLSVEAGDLGQEIVFPVDDTPHPIMIIPTSKPRMTIYRSKELIPPRVPA